MLSIPDGPAWIMALVATGNFYLTYRNGKKSEQRGKIAAETEEQRNTVTQGKLKEIHESTNGMSVRAEAIAKKLGVEEGKAVGLKEGTAVGLKQGRDEQTGSRDHS